MTVSNMRHSIHLFVSLVLLFVLGGCASTGSSSSGPKAPVMGSAGASSQQGNDDLIRVGDSLAIRLSGVPVNDQGIYEVQVDESGNVSMPYIGNVSASGITAVALKQKIEASYREKGIFPSSNIQIFTREARFVTISGEVRSPQRLTYTKDLTLTGAISACGGFTEYSNKKRVKLLRGGQSFEENIPEILKNPAQDVPLKPNDIIQVDRSIF